MISGAAGIGKSALLDRFLAELEGEVSVLCGQCLPYYGSGEPYHPVLGALSRFCREAPENDSLTSNLRRCAPAWLAQMPWLLPEEKTGTLSVAAAGATPVRMLRENLEFFDRIGAEKPVLLVLEDLQWSDHATLELVAALARQRSPAPLLLIGSYRHDALNDSAHPLDGLVHELCLRPDCEALRLDFLDPSDVTNYLTARFPNLAETEALGILLHRCTEGHPLFMVNLVAHWLARCWLQHDDGWVLRTTFQTLEHAVPSNLRNMILQRFAALDQDQRAVLENASVLGMAFSSALIAAGVQCSVIDAERRCRQLVLHGLFLTDRAVDAWPDGTVASGFALQHVLYQKVLYEALTAAHCIRLHSTIGLRLEAGYGERAGDIAASLALHFGCGRDFPRAVRYHRQAGMNAARLCGYREAISHLDQGLKLLEHLPETEDRNKQESALQQAMGQSLAATEGYASAGVQQAYARAKKLCDRVAESPESWFVLHGLWAFYVLRGRLQTARKLALPFTHKLASIYTPGQQVAIA